jgi:Caspase domain/Sel1 repeat
MRPLRLHVVVLALLIWPWCLAAQQAVPSVKQANPFDTITFAELNRKANAGDAAAQDQLGNCYWVGFCFSVSDVAQIKQDLSKGVAWFQKAAAQHYPPAEFGLATSYMSGRGVPQDQALGLVWLRKAADDGDANAACNLGVLYHEGSLVPQDMAKAREWLQLSADLGNPEAEANLQKLNAAQSIATIEAAKAKLEESAKAVDKFLDQPADSSTAATASIPVASAAAPTAAELQKLDAPPQPPAQPPSVSQAEIDAFLAANAAPASVPAASSATPSRGFAPEFPAGAASTAGPVAIPHNYALIFATDDYAHWPHLNNPISDADAVNEALTSLYNFHVEEIRNPTADQVLAKLREYLHRKFEPQDQLLIVFSGHGYFDPDLKVGFLVPADGLLVQDDTIHRSLLSHESIKEYVDHIPSQHVVLAMDACFSGTFDRRIADSGQRGVPTADSYTHATLPELLARKQNKRTRRYFTSGGNEFVPDGRPGHHTPFISALLVTLNRAADNKGYVTLDDIQQGFDTVEPEPRWGDISDDNDPTSDFLLLTPDSIAKLTTPN